MAGTAWEIFNNPDAGIGGWTISGGYLLLWGGAHAALAVGVAGLACVAAGPGCVVAVEGALGIGGTSATNIFIRYVSSGELNAINNTGYLRGGNPGRAYFTTDLYTTVSEAEQALSLENPPGYGVQFEILNSPAIVGPNIVKPIPWSNLLGGGIEYYSENLVQVNIIDIWELIK